MPAETSERRDLAMLAARTTLQEGVGWISEVIVRMGLRCNGNHMRS